LQMFSHGILAGLLFAVVGRMVYARTHTRELSQLDGMDLGRKLPFAATVFLIAALASVGLPGFSGFVAELHVITGAWSSFSYTAIMAGIGIVIGVAYSLRALLTVFWPSNQGCPPLRHEPLPAITAQEKIGSVLLIGTSLIIGIYPRLILDLVVPSLHSPLLEPLIGSVAGTQ
jgi:NADH-quinone oxidoreductase subunit M